MNIGVCGYFQGNFGDNLFLKAWKDLFNEHNIINLYHTDFYQYDIDKVIIGGGAIIEQSMFESSIFRQEFLSKPTYIYGIGVNDTYPLNYDVICQYNRYFEQCKYIALRSKLDFVKVDYDIVKDIVWAIDLPTYSKNPFSNTIGISLNTTYYDNNILELCKHIIDSKYNILIIDMFNHYANTLLYTYLCSLYGKNKIKFIQYRNNSDRIIKLIAGLKFFITQKLHGFIIAMKTKTPSLCIGNIAKYKVIKERLNNPSYMINDTNNLIEHFNNHIMNNYNFDIVDVLIRNSKNYLLKFKDIVLNE